MRHLRGRLQGHTQKTEQGVGGPPKLRLSSVLYHVAYERY